MKIILKNNPNYKKNYIFIKGYRSAVDGDNQDDTHRVT